MMKKKKVVNSIKLPAAEESMEEALLFFRQRLDAESISKEIVSETMLVVEALFHNILEQTAGIAPMLELSCKNKFGNVLITVGYEGKQAYLYTENDGVFSPDDRILQAYEDKIGQSYHAGFNTFNINVKRKHLHALLYSLVAGILAVLLYLLLDHLMPRTAQYQLLGRLILPLEQLFGNAALMIGAPVTFFSLLKNLTDTYLLSNRYSEVRKLRGTAIITAVVMVLLAIGTGLVFLNSFGEATVAQDTEMTVLTVLSELISEAIPSSIFEPFEVISPIPLIVLSLIAVFALSSSGQYLEKLKKAVDIAYALFSRMLGLVLFVFPFFFFIAILDLLMLSGISTVLYTLLDILLIIASTSLIAVFYLIRLKAGGVRLRPFLKKLPPLLLENLRIGSSIDAVPFNIRYCTRNYGMNRRRLERSLPALAQTMFDGNCFLLMSIAFHISVNMEKGTAWYSLALIALLVLFLSFGAPNQPGSILIGTIIILKYLDLTSVAYMYIPILYEAAFGFLQNLINATGDIVTVTIADQKANKKEQLSAEGS